MSDAAINNNPLVDESITIEEWWGWRGRVYTVLFWTDAQAILAEYSNWTAYMNEEIQLCMERIADVESAQCDS